MQKEKIDILVIGAGPSGTVAASIIKQHGLSVQVVEKQKFPRFVIGESLIPSCMDPLEKAGFMDALNAQGYQKKFGARFIRNGEQCMFDFGHQYTNGWTWTWQLPRADFDKVLADEVEKMGVPVHYETAVTTIEWQGTDSLTTVVDKNGKSRQIEAKYIIDASGYGRVIPRMLDLDAPSSLPPRQARFTHCKDMNRPEGFEGTMITFIVHRREIWIWCIPFSNGITSLGVVGDPTFFNDFPGGPEEAFRAIIESEPYYRDRFRDVPYLFEPVTQTAYSIGVKKLFGEGFALTGNSTEFLDPVFSSGVAFATNSGCLAAELACKQVSGQKVDWQAEYEDYILSGVDVFRTYVKAWYDGSLQEIFFTEEHNDEIRKQICSVLAGYVWDRSNPFVKKHKTAVPSLARVIEMGRK